MHPFLHQTAATYKPKQWLAMKLATYMRSHKQTSQCPHYESCLANTKWARSQMTFVAKWLNGYLLLPRWYVKWIFLTLTPIKHKNGYPNSSCNNPSSKLYILVSSHIHDFITKSKSLWGLFRKSKHCSVGSITLDLGKVRYLYYS
jgi:hypothetical protein